MFVLTLVYSILIYVRQEKIPDSYDKCEPGLILDRICAQWYVNEPRMAALYPLLEFTGLHILFKTLHAMFILAGKQALHIWVGK